MRRLSEYTEPSPIAAAGRRARRLAFAAALLAAHLPVTAGRALFPDGSAVRRSPGVVSSGAAAANAGASRLAEPREGSSSPLTPRPAALLPKLPDAFCAHTEHLAADGARRACFRPAGPPSAARGPPSARS